MQERPGARTDFTFRAYGAGSHIAAHTHACSSLTIILGGSYEEEIGGRSGMERRGSALVCPAGVPHSQQFGARGAYKIIVTPGGDLLDYLTGTTPFRSASVARSTAIARLAARIDAEQRTNDEFSRGAIEGLIWQASAELGRGSSGSSIPLSTIVRHTIAMIVAADGEPLSMTDLSRSVDCHPATLTRAFRREHGCTPGAYQREMRVRKAADMIRTTALPIAAIATRCGFCDQAHLARSFRAVLGCSPSEYRRRA
ncbi:helix-turn-helix domain-containing protein [Sphingomonas sp.]|uniref:helix-turn-helix domain-containing protein n=1 Tax=Sphingomonas sp. TaxID=28214 RepID=UPI003B3B284C